MSTKTEKEKKKRYFVYTSVTSFILLDFFWNEVYFKYTSEFKKKYIIWEIYFKYTSEFAHKDINLESLLQVYFRVSK